MAGPADAAELFDVDVDELARSPLLVAVGRLERLQPPELAKADPGQDPRHRRERHRKRLRDLRPRHPQAAQTSDHRNACLIGPRRHRARRRAAIEETLLPLTSVAASPLRDGTHAHAGGLGRRRERPPLALNPINREATTMRTGPRVSVQLHPDHPPWSWWLGSSSLQGGPDGTTLSGTTASGRGRLRESTDWIRVRSVDSSAMTHGGKRVIQAVLVAPGCILAAAVLAFLLGVDFGPLQGFMGRWSFLILEFGGAMACLVRAWRVNADRRAWTLIGIGVFLWAVGDAYYRVVLYNMTSPPLPSLSPADACWIAFYPFVYAGIGLLIRERTRNINVTIWIDGLIAALAVASVAAAVVFDVVLGSIGGAPLTTAVNLRYPLADILLMAFVVAGFAMTGWRLDRTWVWLAASLGVFAISDSIYLYQVANGTYSAGGVLDAGWMLALNARRSGCVAARRPQAGGCAHRELALDRLSYPVRA